MALKMNFKILSNLLIAFCLIYLTACKATSSQTISKAKPEQIDKYSHQKVTNSHENSNSSQGVNLDKASQNQAAKTSNEQFVFVGTIVEVSETGLGPLRDIKIKDERTTANFQIIPNEANLAIGQKVKLNYHKEIEPLVVAMRMKAAAPVNEAQIKKQYPQELFKVTGEYVNGTNGDLGVYIKLKDKIGKEQHYVATFEADFYNVDKYKGKEVELTYIEEEKVNVTDYTILK